MPSYKEFSDRIKKTKFSWQVRKIRDEVTKSGLPNATINGLHERCQLQLEKYERKWRTRWDWIRKWVWPILAALIAAIIAGIIVVHMTK